ncbi:hypothetical protein Q5P01_025857 [Channa striata]|uniref:Uncharacterized protein n=1 Tax=Channa striata TaxID=64152 RepID=A0AA88LM56_CHASR|nr:hypothetical protein Q5P01_025857 [Channa striata]
MSCVDAGITPAEGQEGSVGVRAKLIERQVIKHGAVLPESQAQFLEEIVELSSEADTSVGHNVVPAFRQQGARAVTTGTGQQPQTSVHTAADERGGLLEPHVGPPPAEVTGSVTNITAHRMESATDGGVAVAEDTDCQAPVIRSPKVRRTQRRPQVQAVQGAEVVGCHSGVGAGNADLLDGNQLVDLDLTPTLTPEVQRRMPLIHAAQFHRESGALAADLLEDVDVLFSQSPVVDHTSTPRTGITPAEGQEGSVGVRAKLIERQVIKHGAVLPESQAQFLEEIVELSSEADTSVGHNVVPAFRQQGARAVTTGTGQQPQTSVHTAADERGGLLEPHVGPPPAEVTGSVTNITAHRMESATDGGVAVARGHGLPGSVIRSPKVRRTQRRPQVQAVQGLRSLVATQGWEQGTLTC